MALKYPYSNITIKIFNFDSLDPLCAKLRAAFPELPADRTWIAYSFGGRKHMGIMLSVGDFNQSQVGDMRQRAFEVLRKELPGLNPKDVLHETGWLIVPGRI